MKIQTIEQLVSRHIEQLHHMEKVLTKAIPKLIKEAESDDLKDVLDSHLLETREQVKRLEEIGQVLDLKLTGENRDPVEGILKAEEKNMKTVTDPNIKDLMIIGGSGKVEHYEISCYEAAISIANKAGMDTSTLKESLDEEESMANKLKMINSGGIVEFLTS